MRITPLRLQSWIPGHHLQPQSGWCFSAVFPSSHLSSCASTAARPALTAESSPSSPSSSSSSSASTGPTRAEAASNDCSPSFPDVAQRNSSLSPADKGHSSSFEAGQAQAPTPSPSSPAAAAASIAQAESGDVGSPSPSRDPIAADCCSSLGTASNEGSPATVRLPSFSLLDQHDHDG